MEISSYKEKVQWLENKILELQSQLTDSETRRREELDQLSKHKNAVELMPQKNGIVETKKECSDEDTKCNNVSRLR